MNILIFAGTTEGRKLIETIASLNINITAIVATEYGSTLIDERENVEILSKRLECNEMENLIREKNPKCVIDTTHPYAKVVTQNIKTACENTGTEYIRLLREKSEEVKDSIYVDDMEMAAKTINELSGNVLVTTGSKELDLLFSRVKDTNRLFCRVLPTKDVLEKCHDLKVPTKNIVAMQGPFSKEMNKAICKMHDISIMLTKDGGDIGGFSEKVMCAKELSLTLLTIGRPFENVGISFCECVSKIEHMVKGTVLPKRFPIFLDLTHKNILVVGGGNIAKRRIVAISSFCENIKVVAPNILDDIKNIDNIECLLEEFDEKHLEDVHICLACTDNRDVNHLIYNLCKNKDILHSICDKKEECSFYFPGIIEENDIVIGICGTGENHAATKEMICKLREKI